MTQDQVVLDVKGRFEIWRGEFGLTARQALDAAGFAPNQIDAFCARAESSDTHWIARIERPDGHHVFLGGAGRQRHRMITFILPSCPAERMALATAAIEAMRAMPDLQSLRIRVSEIQPSHLLWLLETLPKLGFVVARRVSLSLDRESVNRLPLPPLAPEFTEVDFTPDRLADCAECVAEAFVPLADLWPPNDEYRTRGFWEEELAPLPVSIPGFHMVCTLVARGGRIVGYCDAGRTPEHVVIRNVAVRPAFRRRGLGTYLLLRSARRLMEQTPDRRDDLLLNTWRDHAPAMAFYHTLGFQPIDVWTDGSWRRPSSPEFGDKP